MTVSCLGNIHCERLMYSVVAAPCVGIGTIRALAVICFLDC